MVKRTLTMLGAGLIAPLVLAAESEPVKEAAGKLKQPVGVGEVLQVFLALVVVLALIGVTAWVLRRYSLTGLARPGVLRMLASVSVGQRERIVLVQAGETQMLLGVAQGSVRTLHVFDKPVMVDNAEVPGGQRFAERLAAALNKRGGEGQ